VKAAAIVLAALLVLGHLRVTVPAVAQPVPALALVFAAELLTVTVLTVAIARSPRIRTRGST
jgi:hypothetical protein